MIQELLNELIKSESIIGVISIGSPSYDIGKDSDIDLILILSDNSPDLTSALSKYKGKLLDLYFFKKSDLENLLNNLQKDSALNLQHKALMRWVESGNIEYDKTGLLTKIKTKNFPELSEKERELEKYNLWFKINFNYSHNKRYFESGKKTYLDALKIRLLYSLNELFVGYFIFRDLEWKGEKQGIIFLEKEDNIFLNKYLDCLDEIDISSKFKKYLSLIDIVVSPYKSLWTTSKEKILTNTPSDVASEFIKSILTL